MSSATSTTAGVPTGPARPASQPASPAVARAAERRLTVVPTASPAPAQAPFVGLVLVLIVGGLMGLLLLNTAITQDAFTVADLQGQATRLADREQALEQQLAVEASPQRLAERALGIGMVPSSSPAFIRAEDGAILGVPTPAEDLPPVLVPLLPGAEPGATAQGSVRKPAGQATP
jgi:hypothetical protein